VTDVYTAIYNLIFTTFCRQNTIFTTTFSKSTTQQAKMSAQCQRHTRPSASM